jgi:very-short-patch-repair endonuclease
MDRERRRSVDRARELRRRMTFPERLLWSKLRAGRLFGLKFRKQHPFGPYVLDYFCDAKNVCVELDSNSMSHVGREAEDEVRSRYIEQHGIRILRVTNDDVLNQMEGVLNTLARGCGIEC